MRQLPREGDDTPAGPGRKKAEARSRMRGMAENDTTLVDPALNGTERGAKWR